MYPPYYFILFDVFIQLVMTLVSVGIALFAYRGFRWVRERSLYYLSLAFGILALGYLVNGVVLGYDFLFRLSGPPHMTTFPLLDSGFAVYYASSILAFAILVYAYLKNIRDAAMVAAAFGIFLTATAPFMETIIIVLLSMIVLAQLIHLGIHSSRSSKMVSLSFILLLSGHILVLASGMGSETYYVMGKLIQLAAFGALLLTLLAVRRPV